MENVGSSTWHWKNSEEHKPGSFLKRPHLSSGRPGWNPQPKPSPQSVPCFLLAKSLAPRLVLFLAPLTVCSLLSVSSQLIFPKEHPPHPTPRYSGFPPGSVCAHRSNPGGAQGSQKGAEDWTTTSCRQDKFLTSLLSLWPRTSLLKAPSAKTHPGL